MYIKSYTLIKKSDIGWLHESNRKDNVVIIPIIISIGENTTMNILHQTFRLHPQISSGVVGFVVFGLGDVLSQTTERRKENNNSNSSNNNVDYVRTMQTGTLGVVMNGGEEKVQ